jgi:hypothetical protein
VAEAGRVNTSPQLVRHPELYGTEKISKAACCASTLMSSPPLSVGLANSIPTRCCQPSSYLVRYRGTHIDNSSREG